LRQESRGRGIVDYVTILRVTEAGTAVSTVNIRQEIKLKEGGEGSDR